MKKILVGFMLFFGSISYGQSVTGTSGLIHIPSARMLEDGQLVLGAAYIPKPYFTSTAGLYRFQNKASGLNTYLTYGILPFVEVMFRYTHEIGAKVNVNTNYFPDRMFSLRIRLLNEGKIKPCLTIGFEDISSIIGTHPTAKFFVGNYIVGNKTFKSKYGFIDIVLGRSFDLKNHKSKQYEDFFYGLSLQPNSFQNFKYIIEYNSRIFHTGIKWRPLKPVNLMFGLWDLSKPTFSINLNI